MTYRRIAALPLVWAALFVFAVLFSPPSAYPAVFLAQSEASKALAAVGCAAAALAFERGDYMRRAWAFNGVCYLFLFTRDVSTHLVARDAVIVGMNIAALEGLYVVVANVASCVGTALLARAWATAGLELPGTKASRYGMMLVGALIAVAVSGSDLIHDARLLLAGDLSTAHSVASDIGDVVGLALIAPVLLTAIAMRGGALMWPWTLLTASLVFWLVYDAVSLIEHAMPGRQTEVRIVRESARALACGCEFAAALAQRRVVLGSQEDEATA